MIASLRSRILIFCAILGGLLLLIAITGVSAWRDLGELRRRFTTAEFESFRIAGQLQANVLELNSALLAYERTRNEEDWTRFENKGRELNAWIDRQRDVLKTTAEKRILSDIDVEYDRYLGVANRLRGGRQDNRTADSPFRRMNTAAERMFTLAARLADAHRKALGDFLRESQRSLGRVESLFGFAFIAVLASCGWGAHIIIRDSIMPLRKQVVEARALAEKHEKMASLGVLAAGVAHEIRNPLTAIKTRLFTLDRRLEAMSPAREDTNVIASEISRLEHIVKDFLLFARPAEPEFTLFKIEPLFHEMLELLRPELAARGVEMIKEHIADELAVRADRRQLKQVLINLIHNGAESIHDGGRVILRAREDHAVLAGVVQSVVVLEVTDTGSGIPLAVQERLFDPFYTTKESGTGLGLSIAVGILEKHGGALQFKTLPGQGSTFGILLPRPAALDSATTDETLEEDHLALLPSHGAAQ